MLGASKRDAPPLLEGLAAQGIAQHVAAFVGEVTVKSVAEATHYPAVLGSFVTQIKCEWNRRNGVGDLKLLKVNSTLQSLDLSFNNLGETGGQAIAEALKLNSTLQTLNLYGNKLGETGGQAIAEALKVNSTLQTLNLQDNNLGETGGQAIAEAFKVKSTLQTLYR